MCFVLYGCIRDHVVAYETRCKTGRSSAKVRTTKSSRNFLKRTHPIHPIGPETDIFVCFRTIWVHSGPFGCLTKLDAKRAEVVQKFVPRSRVGIFCNEHTRSTPLDPKLTFRCISYYFSAFGTVCLPYETWCKTGRASAKVCSTNSRWNFSQRTHPIHSI